MIKIHVERRQSKQLFWCQACGSKQSRTVDEEKLIRMYLERFSNVEINDDDNKLIITYSDAFEGNLINEYLDCLANVVNINVERQRKNEGV